MQAFSGLRIDTDQITADSARNTFVQRRLQNRIVCDICAQRRNGIHSYRPPGAINVTELCGGTLPTFRAAGRR